MFSRILIVFLGLVGLGLVAESVALAIQGRWLLAAEAISIAVILGTLANVTFTLRATRVEQRNALVGQVKVLEKVERRIAGIAKDGALERQISEGKLWDVPI